MNVSICIPFYLHGAHPAEIGRVMQHYAHLPFRVHLCGSEGEHSRQFAAPYLNETTHYCEVEQEGTTRNSGGSPILLKKFNDSLKTLRGTGTWWYCMVGHNDIIPQRVFEILKGLYIPYPCIAGVSSDQPTFMVDGERAAQIHLSYSVTFAPGMTAFTAGAMYDCDFMPYQYEHDEIGVERFAVDHGWKFLPLPGWVVQMKGRDSLNSFDHIAEMHRLTYIEKKQLPI